MNLARSVPFPDKTRHMTTDVLSGWLFFSRESHFGGQRRDRPNGIEVDSTAHEYAPPQKWYAVT